MTRAKRSDPNCPFCGIARAGNNPIETIDGFIAFRARDPVAPVHILVTPDNHVESLMSLHDVEMAALLEFAHRLGQKFCAGGHRLAMNFGADAGQQIHHIHLHVIGGHKLGGIG